MLYIIYSPDALHRKNTVRYSVPNKLDTALQKFRAKSCLNWCRLVGKHRRLTESRLFAENLSADKTGA